MKKKNEEESDSGHTVYAFYKKKCRYKNRY